MHSELALNNELRITKKFFLYHVQRKEKLCSIATSVSTKETTWIFTDQQSSSVNGSLAAQDYKDAAALRESLFISVILRCDLDENIRRMGSSGRGGHINTKLTDAGILQIIRATEDLYSFGGDCEFELDISKLSASQAASRIYEQISMTCSILPAIMVHLLTYA